LLSAQMLTGAGSISAKGGAGDLPDGGGGGGGRIAIYFGTNNFTGNITAIGGNGARAGGAGTIYIQPIAGPVGELIITNNGQPGSNTTFDAVAIDNLTISGGGMAQAQNSLLAVSNLFIGSGSSLIPLDTTPLSLTVNGDATVQSNGFINADLASST